MSEKPDTKSPTRTNTYQDWLEKEIAANSKKRFVSKEDIQKANDMIAACKQSKIANHYLDRLERTQLTILWEHKETGLPLISKIDGDGGDFTLEVKTAADASPDGFMRAAFNLGYHCQAGTYNQAYKRRFKFPTHYYLAVEKNEPYNVSVLKPTDDYIALGEQWLEQKLQEFKHCLNEELWDMSYDFYSALGYHTLDLPPWGKKQLD